VIVFVCWQVRLPGCTEVDLVPAALVIAIDRINELVYDKVGLSACAPRFHYRILYE